MQIEMYTNHTYTHQANTYIHTHLYFLVQKPGNLCPWVKAFVVSVRKHGLQAMTINS